MNDMLNNTGLWLSIGASFIGIIGGIVSLAKLWPRQGAGKSGATLSNSGQAVFWPQPKGIGYHFGCVLKTIIIVVLIIALATALTYVTMAFIALYIETHQPTPYMMP